MAEEKIVETIKKAREAAPKRNFKQTFDLAVNLRSIDLKKPENKIKLETNLPHGLGKSVKIGIIADMLIPAAKALDNVVLVRKDELEGLGRNKRAAKALAAQCRALIAEAPLMPLVGKFLGPVLAPRGLMPKPVPANANLGPIVKQLSSMVRLNIKDSPVLHCAVGSEDMADEQIAANAESVLKVIEAALPKGKEQLRSAVIKLTMGKPVKITL